jgi:transposase
MWIISKPDYFLIIFLRESKKDLPLHLILTVVERFARLQPQLKNAKNEKYSLYFRVGIGRTSRQSSRPNFRRYP